MKSRDKSYRVFVVRCWDESMEPHSEEHTRFVLEIPKTGERFGFTDTQKLLIALQQQLNKLPPHGKIGPPS